MSLPKIELILLEVTNIAKQLCISSTFKNQRYNIGWPYFENWKSGQQ